MTPRFKVGLVVFGALALATAALWLALGGFGKRTPSRPQSATANRPGVGADGQPLTVGTPGGLEGTGEDVEEPIAATAQGVTPGLRKPSGDDLSDPRVLKKLLSEQLAQSPVDWDTVVELVRVMKEPLDLDMKERFLAELRTGHRHGVLSAIAVLQDGSLGSDLLQMLDDSQLSGPARQAVLQGLEVLPSGNRDEIVLGLESRMTGDLRNDQLILRAIAGKGGVEAARALVQYIQNSKDAPRLQTYILQRFDLRNDPEAAKFVAQALTAEQPPATLRSLLDLAAKPGAKEMVDPLIALNHDGVPDDIRQSAVASLARVATDKAVEYLLSLAQQPGVYGEVAVTALGRLEDASRESMDKLLEVAGKASQTPRPEDTKAKILVALGQMRHPPALPLMGESLKDSSMKVRLSAVGGLGRFGAPARSYVPELVSLYSTGDDTMRRSIVMALGSIGGETARGALRQMEQDPTLPPGLKRSVTVAITAVESATAERPTPEPGTAVPGLGGTPR